MERELGSQVDRRVTAPGGMSRRDLFRALGITAGFAAFGGCTFPADPDRVRPPDGVADPAPFIEGVIAGDPRPDGSTIWTRLEPGAAGGPLAVLWTVATDPAFTAIVAGGTTTAVAARDHCVTVEVSGLAADSWYWYRFEHDGVASRAGRLRTAPAPGSSPDHLRFAFASCQQLTDSWFVAHRAAAAEDLDFFVHLGDYVYVDDTRTVSLDDYRSQYRRWRRQPMLRDLHAAVPLVAMWDDGEFVNGVDRTFDPPRAAAARQAWFESFPVLDPGDQRLYRHLGWGDLVDMPVVDVRSYRDPAVDEIDNTTGEGTAVNDPVRTTLGAEQYQWLTGLLAGSTARWRSVATGYNVNPWRVLNLEFLRPFRPDLPANAGVYVPNEAFDDYMAERRRLLSFLADNGIADSFFTSAHTHVAMATALRPDQDDPSAPVVAHDFCAPSLTADPDPRDAYLGDLPRPLAEDVIHLAEEWILGQNSPYLRHINFLDQGYVVVDVDPDEVTVDYRMIDTFDPAAEPYTGARFRLRHGQPLAERIPTATDRGRFA